jgi:Domain of Unknown Function with PDB structure (DUF3857)/Transglutaminase-like superfamily
VLRQNRRKLFTAVVLAGIALGSPQISVAADPPVWLRDAARSVGPTLDRNVPALVLLNDQRVTIEDDGRVLTATSYAVRILTRAGRLAAGADEVYRTDTGKVRDLRAWLIPSTGVAREYGKDEILDVALVNNDVYNEARVKRIAAGDEAQPGSVFGYESLSEDRAIFTQFEFQFQVGLPALLSRFALTVPNGWRVESVTFNHDPIRPVLKGTTYTWQLDNLPFVEDEPASPELSSLVARVAVSVFPPEGSRASLARTFASWQDVSRWLTELNDPQVIVNDEIATKAKTLTATAATDYDRIAAIGKFVQGIQYVSIQTGIGRGGGYRPHTSADVLAKAYGDCKDKANLMRAMLKAVGITSYPVAIFSGDPDYVRQEWPSPQQFNHAVLAIVFPQEKTLHSVFKHPALGPLMIFDPTDPETLVGELPDDEQGSFALIVAGERGDIVRMPVSPSEANRLERTVEATLGADGSLSASVREQSIGHSAVAERREYHAFSRTEYEKLIEAWVGRSVSGARVSNVSVTDDASTGNFTLKTDFAARSYGQLMQNRLLIFKPAIVSRRTSLFLTESQRRHPIMVRSQAYTETVRVKLPPGFQVDELPDPVKMQTEFGTYSATHTVENGDLIFTRLLTLRRSVLPAEQYSSVRAFYERILAAEQAPAVLLRK